MFKLKEGMKSKETCDLINYEGNAALHPTQKWGFNRVWDFRPRIPFKIHPNTRTQGITFPFFLFIPSLFPFKHTGSLLLCITFTNNKIVQSICLNI
jgi:hypothetical protein